MTYEIYKHEIGLERKISEFETLKEGLTELKKLNWAVRENPETACGACYYLTKDKKIVWINSDVGEVWEVWGAKD